MAGQHAKELVIKRCAIYTRKSTTHGLEQEYNSLDAQRDACAAYIVSQAAIGWRAIPESYDDGGFTGANIERPAFQNLLEDIDKGDVDVVVVNRLDRLSRSLADFVNLMARFNEAGVDFVSVTQNFSTTNPIGRLTLNMLMSFAEFEREMIAERTREKIAAQRRRGKWTGGPSPFGYDFKEGHLLINAFESVVVVEMYQFYVDHRSALVTARLLNEKGRTTRKGRSWTKAAVLHILQNPIYAGLIPYKDERYEGEHEVMIPIDKWQATQDIVIEQRRIRKHRYHNGDYFLRGLLYCDICGGRFIPASTRQKSKVYRYYRCTTRDKGGARSCAARQLPAGSIEGFVVERIKEATGDGSLVQDLQDSIQETLKAQKAALRRERAGLPEEIAKTAAKNIALISRLDQVSDHAMEAVESKIAEVGQTQKRLENRLEAVTEELTALEKLDIEAEWLARTLENFSHIWEKMTPANRHRLMRAVVDKVVVNEPQGTIETYLADFTLTGEEEDESGSEQVPPSPPLLRLVQETETSQ